MYEIRIHICGINAKDIEMKVKADTMYLAIITGMAKLRKKLNSEEIKTIKVVARKIK